MCAMTTAVVAAGQTRMHVTFMAWRKSKVNSEFALWQTRVSDLQCHGATILKDGLIILFRTLTAMLV